MSEEPSPFTGEPHPEATRSRRSTRNAISDIQRLPPNSEQAEKGLLGSILMSPSDCLMECVEKLKPGAACFYDLKHQLLYSTLLEMWQQNEAIDIITIQQRLKNRNQMEDVGGLAYLCALPDATPSAANARYYIDIVLEKYVLRKMVQTCTKIVGRVYEYEGDVETLLGEVERDILAIGNDLDTSDGIADLHEVRLSLVEKYERAAAGDRPGLMTGFIDIDRVTGGMQPQDMIVLMGEQSCGKTSLAMNIAWNVVLAGTTVGILSLETSVEKLLHRIYCSIAEVNGTKFMKGEQILEWEMKAMLAAIHLVDGHKHKLLIDDSGGLSANRMVAKVRKMRQLGARLFITDYLQLLHETGSEYERVSKISVAFKDVAKETNCPSIVLSSLNRDGSKGDGKPKIRNARGSGQLDYDGNQFWILSSEDAGKPVRSVKLNVAKNKDGETGEVDLTLFAASFKFKDAARENH